MKIESATSAPKVGSSAIVRLLEGLELSLADDMTLGGAVCRGFDPAKDFSPIVAFLRLQQRYLDLCTELNYKPTRKLTGMPREGDEPNAKMEQPRPQSSALPVEAGFYWWRKYPDQEWRMVHIVDFAAGYPGEPPHLAAYDVEYRAWGGRTLRLWALHDPIGEWMPCRKPNEQSAGTTPEESA